MKCIPSGRLTMASTAWFKACLSLCEPHFGVTGITAYRRLVFKSSYRDFRHF